MPEPSRSPSAVAPEPQGHGPAQGVPDGRPPLLSLPRLRTLQLTQAGSRTRITPVDQCRDQKFLRGFLMGKSRLNTRTEILICLLEASQDDLSSSLTLTKPHL
ncbi:unnamed protein product [Rangifer tarandus platyrhynchus]|uniref:Uncharacterized protein n=1 Tax=Rangifer tarandus platyrhynchus TaxID=3082113 RepID=A0ABN8Z4U6_RANTA|nr:unnamed protein product [Rangifer tarandus platyrhynchus]